VPLKVRYVATVLHELYSTDDYVFAAVIALRVMVYRLLQDCVEICSEFDIHIFPEYVLFGLPSWP
jgi:hypothetical protein